MQQLVACSPQAGNSKISLKGLKISFQTIPSQRRLGVVKLWDYSLKGLSLVCQTLLNASWLLRHWFEWFADVLSNPLQRRLAVKRTGWKVRSVPFKPFSTLARDGEIL